MADKQERSEMGRYSDQVDQMRARIEELQRRATDAYADRPQIDEVLAELLTTLEELQVGEEELREQYDELVRTRGALEREQQRFQELFQHAPDAYLVTNQHGDIQDVNLAAVELLNLEPRLLAGKPIITFIPIEGRAGFREQLRELKALGLVREWETRIQPRHHEPVDVAISARVVYDAIAGPVALRWLVRDISERKRAQEALAALNDELEQRVRERTAELEAETEAKEAAYQKEREARAAAERADTLKLQFLGMISHELRTPLTSIKGFASTLLATDVEWTPEMQHEFIETIEQEADRLTELVDQLLDLSRLRSGSFRINIRQAGMAEIVDSALSQLTHLADHHVITLDLAANLSPVSADPERIAQVLVNLISNAIRFSPDGSAIRLCAAASDGTVEVCVADQGPGIPPELRSNVFEPFQQLGNDQRTRKGAGLGLAICREIVAAHGGTIWIEDNNPGAKVCFRLPAVIAGAPARG